MFREEVKARTEKLLMLNVVADVVLGDTCSGITLDLGQHAVGLKETIRFEPSTVSGMLACQGLNVE